MSVIAWIFIGLLAGWLATRIMGGRGGLMRNLAQPVDNCGHATRIFCTNPQKCLPIAAPVRHCLDIACSGWA